MKARYLSLCGCFCVFAGLLFVTCCLDLQGQAAPEPAGQQNGRWLWARQAGGSDWTYPNSVAIDSAGKAYVAGFIGGVAQFEERRLRSASEQDFFLAKYAPGGALRWVRQFGSGGMLNAADVAVGPSGTVYATGSVGPGILQPGPGRAEVGSATLESAVTKNAYDLWIAAFSPEGSPLWAGQAGSVEETHGESVAVDQQGNLYVSGTFEGRFGQTQLQSAGDRDLFLAKYASGGELLWARRAGGSGEEGNPSVAVSPEGSVYATGFFRGEATFGAEEVDETLTAESTIDMFVAKYASDGTLRWLRKGNTTGKMSEPRDIAVDAEGNSYVAGGFAGCMRPGGATDEMVSTPKEGYVRGERALTDVFVVKYNSGGRPLWAWQGGGRSGSDYAHAVAVDETGSIYVTGSYNAAATFGSVDFDGNDKGMNSRHIFALKLNPEGQVQWVERSFDEGGLSRAGTGVAIQGDFAYVAGFFDVEMRLGDHRLNGLHSRNAFLARIQFE